MANWVRYSLPLCLAFRPCRACEVEVRYPPTKGVFSDTRAIPYENKANGCDTTLCDTISKRYCAIWGGISHWAAKPPHGYGEVPGLLKTWDEKPQSGFSAKGCTMVDLVAQCSATPATVAATPPCSATPFQTQLSVRNLPGMGGGKVRRQNF